MKNVVTKKKYRELDGNIKKVKDINRDVVYTIAKVFFHHLGTPITQESGYNLPMYDWEREEDKISREIKKICSINVYVLTECGIASVHYTKGSKNEWTAHGPCIHLDRPLKLKTCFEKKFILEEDLRKLDIWTLKCLLGIIDVAVVEDWCKLDAKEKMKTNEQVDTLVQDIMENL